MNTNKNHKRIKRMSMASVLFVLAGLISGCVTVQPNKADHDWRDLFTLLNHKAESNATHITLADGSKHRAMDLAAAADTFRWRDARGHAHKHAFAEIVYVDFGRASKSFAKRMGDGLLTVLPLEQGWDTRRVTRVLPLSTGHLTLLPTLLVARC